MAKRKSVEWLTVEHMVKLIEQSIDVNSIVKHDVQLPDLTSQIGKTRQCDIVIFSGQAPRETLTIVEVQHRSRKVDLNTFQGWVTKMREVGAQHLICVSTKGFPDSIKEKAKILGGAIRLIYLKKEDINVIPIKIFGFVLSTTLYTHKYVTAPIFKAANAQEMDIIKGLKFSIHDNIFFPSADQLPVSIETLLKNHSLKSDQPVDCDVQVDLPSDSKPLFIILNGKEYEVKIRCLLRFMKEVIEGEVNLYSYEQEDDGILAWTFRGDCKIQNRLFTVSVPAIQQADGSFNVYKMEVLINEDLHQ